MEPVPDGVLARGGLTGDAHFSPQSIRQLLLVDAETLEELDLSPGAIRENITVRGTGVMQLPQGTRLAIGEAEVEITKECAPCRIMEGVRQGLMRELSGRRGMYAKVVRAGIVRRGDPIRVAEPALR